MRCLMCRAFQKEKVEGITFHRFPLNHTRRIAWLHSLGIPTFNLKPRDVICSRHFRQEDFIHRTNKADGIIRARLFSSALPHANVGGSDDECSDKHIKKNFAACPSVHVESIEQKNDDNIKQTVDTVEVEKNILEKVVVKKEKTSDIYCSVSNCKNDYTTKGDTAQFHKFPISPKTHFELDEFSKNNLELLQEKLKDSACPPKYSICNESESGKRRIKPEPEPLFISSYVEDGNHLDDTPTSETVAENHDLIDNAKQVLIDENAELKATIAKLLKCNENLNANIESQLSYIETIENMCEEKNKKIKELENLLKDLGEISKHDQLSDSAVIEMLDVQPSIQPNNDYCKILKIATICRFCNKDFPSNTTLGAHMRKMHIKHLPFKCHLCVSCYANQAELTRHLKKHPGTKMFACSVCKDRFDEWPNLQEHLTEHNNKVTKLIKNAKNDDGATKTGANYGIIFIEKKSRTSVISGDEESEVQKNIMKMRCNDVMENSSNDET